jgi:hypothetical protein
MKLTGRTESRLRAKRKDFLRAFSELSGPRLSIIGRSLTVLSEPRIFAPASIPCAQGQFVKHAAPHMIARRYGKIINIGSGTAFRGIPRPSVLTRTPRMPRQPGRPTRRTSRTTRPGATGTDSSPCLQHPRWSGPIWRRLVKVMRCRPCAVELPPLARACGIAGNPLDARRQPRTYGPRKKSPIAHRIR